MKKLILFLVLIFASNLILAQEYNVIPLLKKLETGDVQSVKKEMQSLLIRYSGDPSLLFVDALITENGEEASKKFSSLVQKHPKSKYADAALFRLYTYYYAIGSYQTASSHLEKLKNDYPNSRYGQGSSLEIPSEEDDASVTDFEAQVNEKEQQIVQAISPKYLFSIQTGAFVNEMNALSLKNDLENADIFVQIKEKVIGGTTFYVVLAGKFTNENLANESLGQLAKDFKIKGRIVSYEP